MTWRGNRVVVNVQGAQSTQALAEIRRSGAIVLDSSPRYQSATLALRPTDIPAIAALPSVRSVTEQLQPTVAATPTSPDQSGPSIQACTPLTSEADGQLQAAVARSTFGVDGSGQKVGVLSDSYSASAATADIATGDLPGVGNPCGHTTPVEVIADMPPGDGTDEGRAMLQLVHHIAPGSALMFATGAISEADYADNIRALAAAGATVIVDDIYWSSEPMFQDGIIAQAINEVTAEGVHYLTIAANNNTPVGGNNIGSLEIPSPTSTGTCPAGITGQESPTTHCVIYSAADTTAQYTVAPGASISPVLQWAQPRYGVTTDYNLYILNAAGTSVLAKSSDNSPANNYPFESATWTNPGGSANVQIVIYRKSGPDVRLKYLFNNNTDTAMTGAEYATSFGSNIVGPTIFGHSGTDSATTIAAVPYYDNTTPEEYSSRGPVVHYFAPITNASPAAALSSPDLLAKPDVTATDGDCTTFFGGATGDDACPYAFFGTSAAAPIAAAVAALALDANPALGVTQLESFLTGTAATMTGGSIYSSGAGLIDAEAAIGAAPRVPRAPTTVTAVDSGTSADVTFSAPGITGSSSIDSYRATCTAISHPTRLGSNGVSAVTVTGLTVGVNYGCTVAAHNSVGYGPESASAQVTSVSIPTAPLNVGATSVGTTASVSWSPPSSNGGSVIDSYRATCTAAGQTTLSTTTPASPASIPNLVADVIYSCTVEAHNTLGWGPASGLASVSASTAPSAPQNVTAVRGNARAQVSWQQPLSNGGSALTHFLVTASPSGRTCTTATGATTTCAVTGLTNGVAYTFTARAQNGVGTSPASSPSSPVVPATVPTAVRSVGVRYAGAVATITWAVPISNGGAAIIRYQFRYSTNGGRTWTVWRSTGTARKATIVRARRVTYRVQIAAVNAVGAGPAVAVNLAKLP